MENREAYEQEKKKTEHCILILFQFLHYYHSVLKKLKILHFGFHFFFFFPFYLIIISEFPKLHFA